MNINEEFLLPDENYIREETIKKQIIIGHTSTKGMAHFYKWKDRLNGEYKSGAMFSIDLSGQVYKHFDPIYFSNFIGKLEIDTKSITIMLENMGWLRKNEDNNEFINWFGHIYNEPEKVIERRWRNNLYWTPYTNEQLGSTLELVNFLCKEFFIEKTVVSNNTKLEFLDTFSGVLYKSNLEKHFTDLSPAWKFEEFKYKLENNE